MNDMLKSALQGTSRAGKREFIKYLRGDRITRQQAIRSKCYDCSGMGEQKECDMEDCSLYPYSPYRVKPSKSL